MRTVLLLASALVLLAGCRDEGTGPSEARVASIRLSRTAASLDDGATVQITAEPLDRSGRALPAGSVRLAWSSSDEAVAAVAEGLVTGRRPGEARITATVRQVSASATVTVHAVPQSLAAASGVAQQGVAGMPAPQELAVRVTDRHGGGVAGASVEFLVVKGAGIVTPASAQTDAQGVARAAWTLGPAAGENAVEARVAGRTLAPAVFAAMGRAGPPERLERVSGDGQEAPAASQLPLPLVARVSDGNGNPVAGASVAWRSTSGGSVAPDVSVSDGAGEARATWLLGPGAGEQAVEAWVDGSQAARVQFSARAGVGTASRLEKVGGDGQEAAVTQPLPEPLVVRVVDAPGNPVAGARVSWKLGYGGGTVAPPESVTDAQGYARATWTLGTVMATHRLEVRAPELLVSAVSFVSVARVGAPARLDRYAGDGQEADAGYWLPSPLVVRVTDAHGNPVSGVPVRWEGTGKMLQADAATDTLGLARGTWVLGPRAGSQTISAVAAGSTASFSATARIGPTAYIQVGPESTVLPVGKTAQLTYTVADLFGNVESPLVRPLAWTSSDPAVATVSASGLVTAVAGGSATLTASRDGVSGSVRIAVPPEVVSITDLGVLLGGGASSAMAINAAGDVVGHRWLAGDQRRAVLWRNGAVVELGTLGGASSDATAVNDAGWVVGYSNPSVAGQRAFLWKDGVMTDLQDAAGLPRPHSFAYGINAAGHVVGLTSYAHTDGGIAFVWKGGAAIALEQLGPTSQAFGINDAGQVVGYRRTGAGHDRAYLWKDGVTTDLGTLGGGSSYARGINAAGQVVGYSQIAGGWHHAFLWKDGVMTDLGTLGGRFSFALGINDAGDIVGYSETAGGQTRAFVWRNGVMGELGTLGGESSRAEAINAAGQVVGTSNTSAGETHAVLWTIR